MEEREPRQHSYQARIDPAQWAVIREFVYDVVGRSESQVPYKTRELYNAISEFTLWGWQSAALPLEVPGLFNRNVIAYYAQVGCGHLTAAARGNRRSLLLRVAEHLVNTGYKRLPPMPPSNPSEPYSQRELFSTISWARGQTTSARRMNAHVLIALGLGAGLSAQEIIAIRVRDVHRDGDHIDIDLTTGRVRRVPMIQEYAQMMPEQSQYDGDAFAFRPGRSDTYINAISNFITRGAQTSSIRPQSQRMRATWIVRHLNARTPLRVLTAAAGLESLDALGRFERFIDATPTLEAERALRYPSS
ncbi:hypothetical protein N8D74_06625 [Curtobacterium flaccumfaciens]|uniref:Uncharacterized protein n=1 Tax=Curtobacterium poinsettiae TaxID=159612 RepID=A0A9Q9P842_9MICO|nr:hypothetical protein [Curtobacterium flaccumfaciens]UXN26549.1 hypothetical protein N8D74_06625 [Curtobacterium flaccumfaciens]UYC81391.1 hypothetical protein OE229_02710 [Curtobacterium flaccumfaciens pv. poinsettiae]